MPRPVRLDHPGAWHHVMNRGARHGDIFTDDAHCTMFLDTLRDTHLRWNVEVHAYSLMPNHFHLLLRSAEGTLAKAMHRLGFIYTQTINKTLGCDGPLFRGRYRSKLITDDSYLRNVIGYIHLNPVQARLVRHPEQRAWTSHRAHLGLDPRPLWLEPGGVRRIFGNPRQLRDYVRAVHQGSIEWPTNFRNEMNLFAPRHHCEHFAHENQRFRLAAPSNNPRRLEEQLESLAAAVGATVNDLRSAKLGRRENAARNFAVFALKRDSGLTASQIGAVLDMSVQQVHNVVFRRATSRVAAMLDAWNTCAIENKAVRPKVKSESA